MIKYCRPCVPRAQDSIRECCILIIHFDQPATFILFSFSIDIVDIVVLHDSISWVLQRVVARLTSYRRMHIYPIPSHHRITLCC